MKKFTLKKASALFATAIMAMSCGTMTSFADDSASMTLTSAKAFAGKSVTVDLVLETGDICSGYDITVEFDEELSLESIDGAFASEVNGNVISIINLQGVPFKDGKACTTLTFEVPEDSVAGEEYAVEISKIGSFCTDSEEIENPVINNSTITVLETAKPVTNHLIYVEKNVEVVALRGDSNGDGKVDLYDIVSVTKSMMSVVTLDTQNAFFADVNQDGKVDLYDAISLCRYSMASDKENAWSNIIVK